MEGRFRIFLLKKRILIVLAMSLMVLTDVIAADEKATMENYEIGIVLDDEKTGSPQVNKQEEEIETTPKSEKQPVLIKAIPLEENSTQVIQPQIHRRKIDIDEIDTENFEIGVFSGLLSTEDFGTNVVLGLRLAYHISEDFFTEAVYGESTTTETSYERLSGGAKLLTPEERKLTYYNISLGYNLLPGESFLSDGLAFNTAFYVIAGVGITKFAADDRFTYNFGAGYRFIGTDWLTVHFDVRDHIFDIDLLGVKKTAHNLEVHGGVTVFF